MSYSCQLCNYYTSRRDNYERHSISKKHLKNKELNPDILEEPIYNKKDSNYNCKYCNKPFKYLQSMYRHIKYSCKYSNDEDFKELVRLMNLQLQSKDKQLELQLSQNEKQQKQIDKLMGKLQVLQITNNNTTNIQNNIQLLSYNETDVTHLTENDYIAALKKVTYCVKDIIERIHFNPKKPENMNIYISNMKDKYIMVYESGNWNLKNKTNEIDDLYDKKEMLLEEWLDKYQQQYPELRHKFEKYLNNKENDEVINVIKDEIKLMLYNNKKNILE